MKIASSSEYKMTKNVNIRYHFIEKKIINTTITLPYVASKDQMIDLLTNFFLFHILVRITLLIARRGKMPILNVITPTQCV